VEVPRVAEVTGDDLQVGERRRRSVEPDRAREVDPDALTAGLTGTDAACPRVKQHDQAQLLAFLIQRPVPLFVGRERLQRRMQLDSFQAQLGYQVELGP